MKHPFDVCIIGGMGPLATAELMHRIALYTDAKKDSEHPSLCIFSSPDIPDRSEYILNRLYSASATEKNYQKNRLSAPRLPLKAAKKHISLEMKVRSNAPATPLKAIKDQISLAKKLRCRYFAVACNTAHFFCKEYAKVRGIKFINTVKDTVGYAVFNHRDKDICVLATVGTVKADIYGTLSPVGVKIKYPSPPVCEEIMSLIRKIKRGQVSLNEEIFAVKSRIKAEFDTDKTVFILGCTELSLVKSLFEDLTVVDSTDVLAGRIISACKKGFNTENFILKTKFFERETS